MPEQVKRPNPWKKKMIMIIIIIIIIIIKPLWLYVCPEDGGTNFYRNFDCSLPDHTASQRNQNSSCPW